MCTARLKLCAEAWRVKQAVSESDLPPDAEPADLARYVVTVAQGIAVQAAGGAKRDTQPSRGYSATGLADMKQRADRSFDRIYRIMQDFVFLAAEPPKNKSCKSCKSCLRKFVNRGRAVSRFVVGLLEAADVDLLHREHGLHDPSGFFRIRIAQ